MKVDMLFCLCKQAAIKLIRSKNGATAVEFAIIAPVFLIMLLATVEVGRAMWIKSTMQLAVEETARYALVNTSVTTAALETYAVTKVVGADATDMVFQAVQDTSGGTTFVTISGSYSFSVLVPIVPLPDITLTAKSRVSLNP